MKIWKLNLYHATFPYISNGKKIVENRPWSKKRDYRKMKPGDQIVFSDLGSKRKAVAVIKGVRNYKSVKELIVREGLKKCFPWAKSLAEGIGICYGIADDWEERIRKGGIFAIRIKVVK